MPSVAHPLLRSRAVPGLPGLVHPGERPDHRDAGLGLPALHHHAERQPAGLLGQHAEVEVRQAVVHG